MKISVSYCLLAFSLGASTWASVVERQTDPCTASAGGFASLNGGTTGGAGGTVVTVTNQADLERYASASGRYVIKVRGRITISPRGKEVAVASDKTIIGIGTTGEISEGEAQCGKLSTRTGLLMSSVVQVASACMEFVTSLLGT